MESSPSAHCPKDVMADIKRMRAKVQAFAPHVDGLSDRQKRERSLSLSDKEKKVVCNTCGKLFQKITHTHRAKCALKVKGKSRPGGKTSTKLLPWLADVPRALLIEMVKKDKGIDRTAARYTKWRMFYELSKKSQATLRQQHESSPVPACGAADEEEEDEDEDESEGEGEDEDEDEDEDEGEDDEEDEDDDDEDGDNDEAEPRLSKLTETEVALNSKVTQYSGHVAVGNIVDPAR